MIEMGKMKEGRSAFKSLTGIATGKRPLGGIVVDGQYYNGPWRDRYQCGELDWFGWG